MTLFTAPPLADLTDNAWHLCGLMAWMILWWVSEAVPIAVTSLLPMVLVPLLGIALGPAVWAWATDQPATPEKFSWLVTAPTAPRLPPPVG